MQCPARSGRFQIYSGQPASVARAARTGIFRSASSLCPVKHSPGDLQLSSRQLTNRSSDSSVSGASSNFRAAVGPAGIVRRGPQLKRVTPCLRNNITVPRRSRPDSQLLICSQQILTLLQLSRFRRSSQASFLKCSCLHSSDARHAPVGTQRSQGFTFVLGDRF